MGCSVRRRLTFPRPRGFVNRGAVPATNRFFAGTARAMVGVGRSFIPRPKKSANKAITAGHPQCLRRSCQFSRQLLTRRRFLQGEKCLRRGRTAHASISRWQTGARDQSPFQCQSHLCRHGRDDAIPIIVRRVPRYSCTAQVSLGTQSEQVIGNCPIHPERRIG